MANTGQMIIDLDKKRMQAMAESSPFVKLMWSMPEGSQIGDVLELRLNQNHSTATPAIAPPIRMKTG